MQLVMGVGAEDPIDVARSLRSSTRVPFEERESEYEGDRCHFRFPELLIVTHNLVETTHDWNEPDWRQWAVLIYVNSNRAEHFEQLVKSLPYDSVVIRRREST